MCAYAEAYSSRYFAALFCTSIVGMAGFGFSLILFYQVYKKQKKRELRDPDLLRFRGGDNLEASLQNSRKSKSGSGYANRSNFSINKSHFSVDKNTM